MKIYGIHVFAMTYLIFLNPCHGIEQGRVMRSADRFVLLREENCIKTFLPNNSLIKTRYSKAKKGFFYTVWHWSKSSAYLDINVTLRGDCIAAGILDVAYWNDSLKKAIGTVLADQPDSVKQSEHCIVLDAVRERAKLRFDAQMQGLERLLDLAQKK